MSNSFASSPQVPDYLVYKNDTIPTYNLLVEKYLQTRKDDKGRLFDLSFRNSIDGTEGTSLNCWRGYQAIYKIENDSLFVSAIIDCHSLEYKKEVPKNYIGKVFGEKVKNGKVFVDWHSGNISFPAKRNDNETIPSIFFAMFFLVSLKRKVKALKVGNLNEGILHNEFLIWEKLWNEIQQWKCIGSYHMTPALSLNLLINRSKRTTLRKEHELWKPMNK